MMCPRSSRALALILALLVAGTASSVFATEVTFRFAPPTVAETVTVAGTFNDWNSFAALMRGTNENGVWEITLELSPGTHQYKYVVDGSSWLTDESADEFAEDGFGGRNSVLRVGTEPMSVGVQGGSEDTEIGTEVTFRYRPGDEDVNAVSVAGSFNEWDAAAHPLSDADGDGIWEAVLRLAPGDHAYQFVIDDDRGVGDDSAPKHEDDGFGGRNALLTVDVDPVVVEGG